MLLFASILLSLIYKIEVGKRKNVFYDTFMNPELPGRLPDRPNHINASDDVGFESQSKERIIPRVAGASGREDLEPDAYDKARKLAEEKWEELRKQDKLPVDLEEYQLLWKQVEAEAYKQLGIEWPPPWYYEDTDDY